MACAATMMGSAGPASLTATMTVGSTSYVIEIFPGAFVTFYADGYNSGALGALSPDAYGVATIFALYWQSTNNHSTGGQVYLYVTGNRSAGFITSVTCNAVGLGAIGAPSYSGGSDLTAFTIGASGVANPFGTSGTKTIVIS